jgi:hypothetical protein
MAQSRAHSLVGFSEGRPADDFYVTPREAVEALLQVESFDGIIWEPACGDGAISKVLEETGHSVISSDLIDRGYGATGVDFLTTMEFVDHIITNPPFRYAEEFVDQALSSTSGKVAMLFKLDFLGGKKRKAMFARTPLKKVYVFSWRIKMARNGDSEKYKNGSMLTFAWFVWDHAHKGEPTIGWL